MSTIDTMSRSNEASARNWFVLSSGSKGASVNLLARLTGLIETWQKRRRSRIALSKLSERELADIGVSSAQAEFECSKPFWQGTENRMR